MLCSAGRAWGSRACFNRSGESPAPPAGQAVRLWPFFGWISPPQWRRTPSLPWQFIRWGHSCFFRIWPCASGIWRRANAAFHFCGISAAKRRNLIRENHLVRSHRALDRRCFWVCRLSWPAKKVRSASAGDRLRRSVYRRSSRRLVGRAPRSRCDRPIAENMKHSRWRLAIFP